MNEDRQALSKVLIPMTEDEAKALSALDWLERDICLPKSVEAYFWNNLENAADATLEETVRASLRGSVDVGRYRDAFTAHFASRRGGLRLS